MARNPDSIPARAAERQFLDLLCLWRGLYGHRGRQDRVAVATLSDTIQAAEVRIRLRRHHEEQLMRRFTGR